MLAGLLLSSCVKEESKPYTAVHVRVAGNEGYLEMDEMTGQWNAGKGTCWLRGQGFNEELLLLDLKDIKAAGAVQDLTGKNISYSDGAYFRSGRLDSGSVRVTGMGPGLIQGTFDVRLADQQVSGASLHLKGFFQVGR